MEIVTVFQIFNDSFYKEFKMRPIDDVILQRPWLLQRIIQFAIGSVSTPFHHFTCVLRKQAVR